MSKKANNDPIANSLGITPEDISNNNKIVKYIEANTLQEFAREDYDLTRKNVQNILNTGETALEELAQIARASTTPRAYEVLGNFMKQLVEMNKDLIELDQNYKNMSVEQTNPQTINNNLFVGNTAELLKLINKEEKKDDN